MLQTEDVTLESFAKRFLTGRINWWKVVREQGVTNFGNIISLVLFREPPFQVELFIVPSAPSSFTPHTHPDVDVLEFGLSGDAELVLNGKVSHSKEDAQRWLRYEIPTQPVRITPDTIHSGSGEVPYAFLSIQKWLHGVIPTSVGLNWHGEPASQEQADMLHQQMLA